MGECHSRISQNCAHIPNPCVNHLYIYCPVLFLACPICALNCSTRTLSLHEGYFHSYGYCHGRRLLVCTSKEERGDVSYSIVSVGLIVSSFFCHGGNKKYFPTLYNTSLTPHDSIFRNHGFTKGKRLENFSSENIFCRVNMLKLVLIETLDSTVNYEKSWMFSDSLFVLPPCVSACSDPL